MKASARLPMDTRVPAAQRASCHAMNADVLKPVPERGALPPPGAAKANKTRAEPARAELAPVVRDSLTGRSYSKGKLLGKVRLLLRVTRRWRLGGVHGRATRRSPGVLANAEI